jgi:hypothetical protein
MNNVTLGQSPIPGIPDQSRRSVFSNNYAKALASGDPRFNVKQYDRGGVSRGGGQWQQAGVDAAQKMANGIADAYSQDTQTAAYNANNQLAGQQAQEQYALQLGALQQQSAYQQAMAALQGRQQSLNFASSLLGGLLK